MNTTVKMVLSFLVVSILPLSVVGYIGLQGMDQAGTLAVEASIDALTHLGEASIHQRALDVALQIDRYLREHPQLLEQSLSEIESNPELAAIAVQSVGETGYTAVYDSSGITHFHPNPALVGTDMHGLADTLPAFWAIFEISLDGTAVADYYEWREADGSLRDKYMSCVPVGDTQLRVAATTYIDEFFLPMRETELQLEGISGEVRWYLIVAVTVVGFLALGLALFSALGISRPVQRLIRAAVSLEQGNYQSGDLEQETARQDDVGQLARVFDRMAKQVQAREASLQSEIKSLKVQIDEVKRARQVAEVTETEYFQHLQKQVQRMRRSPQDPPTTE